MTRTPGRPKYRNLSKGEFQDAADYAHALHSSGGPDSSHIGEARGLPGFHGKVLDAIWGTSDQQLAYEFDALLSAEQEQKPHIFVRKLPDRKGAKKSWSKGAVASLPPRSKLSLEDFRTIHNAAHFAARYELFFENHITISWNLLGVDAGQTPAALQTFIKSLQDRCRDLAEPIASIYVHENGDKKGLHTHILVTMPVSLEKREAIRQWARDWPQRWRGNSVPNAIRVNGPRKWKAEPRWTQEQLHWVLVSYLLKGADPTLVVQEAAYSPDRKPVKLGHLVANNFRKAGTISFRKRVGVSQNIGSSRQEIGYPNGLDIDRRLKFPGEITTQARPAMLPDTMPTLSPWDSGCRDIWDLYPADFCKLVTRLEYSLSESTLVENDRQQRAEEDRRAFIDQLGNIEI